MKEKIIMDYMERMAFLPFPKLCFNDVTNTLGIYGLNANFVSLGKISDCGINWIAKSSEGTLVCRKDEINDFHFTQTFIDFVKEFEVPLRIRMVLDHIDNCYKCMMFYDDELLFKSLDEQLENIKNELSVL